MAVLNEEQEMLRDMAREWATNESPVTAFRKVRASGDPKAFDESAWSAMAEMGWAGVIIPEEHGGSDFGWLSAGLVVEELGKTLTASPLIATTLAAAAIVLGGSIDEGARHAPSGFATTVSGGKISGTKAFVHEAHAATLFVVAAADGLYLVEAGESVSMSDRKLTDQRSHAEVTFDGASADKLASGKDSLLDDVLDRARILTACEMLGMAQAVFDVRRPCDDALCCRRRSAGIGCRLPRSAGGGSCQGRGEPRASHHQP